MIKISPNLISNLDCAQVSISNILLYKNYTETNTVWKDFELAYIGKADGLGSLYASQKSYKEELKWIHKIDLLTFKFNNKLDFLEKIKSLISKNEPVLLWVDSFYLNYHTYYYKKNELHMVTILDFADDKFILVDHFQNFVGEITESQLLLALDKIQLYTALSINTENSKIKLNKEDYYEIIYNMISSICYSTINKEDKVYGVNAIKEFINDCKEYNQQSGDISVLLESIYNELGQIASRHYQVFNILKHAKQFNLKLYYIENAIYDLGQEWRIVANMTLKGIFKNSSEMFVRVIRKLEEVFELEIRLVDLVSNKYSR
ncbi:BtrH N-terminal domain-containing protein [Lysinibacillus sp. RSDA_15]|uniref:BtrH N-terminal domain-containing protein n=1 Tax=Lysinibacillus TaxID=400634 RepID=UPI0018CE0948|nr:BtrH N-terminal domain-containing protein [Lysinibacillus sphaericus]MBG9754184.1 hypothetical protein [Lysinibacillus sphaericus]QTB11603.1 hypothetical protein J2B92_11545 [Lysinibacillus sphaericus]